MTQTQLKKLDRIVSQVEKLMHERMDANDRDAWLDLRAARDALLSLYNDRRAAA